MATTARDRKSHPMLGTGIALAMLLVGFAAVATAVSNGSTRQIDEQVLRAFRQADDPSKPIGPRWLEGAALDITALGSGFVLGLVMFAVVGFLALQGTTRAALFVFAASAGGWAMNNVLKDLFHRQRPDIVPHLRDVMSTSFPSGHAMGSATVYLTLGALLMGIAERRVTKIYCMAMAALLTALVGVTRVYLGVHYPSDVLAGWLAGLSWALLCWMIERTLARRAGLLQSSE
jgi:undecaprenyl-diphosphatase